jgi:hypothetical protein
MHKTEKLREKSRDSLVRLNKLDKDKLQKVDKQLNDEMSRAFEDMSKILDKY